MSDRQQNVLTSAAVCRFSLKKSTYGSSSVLQEHDLKLQLANAPVSSYGSCSGVTVADPGSALLDPAG